MSKNTTYQISETIELDIEFEVHEEPCEIEVTGIYKNGKDVSDTIEGVDIRFDENIMDDILDTCIESLVQ